MLLSVPRLASLAAVRAPLLALAVASLAPAVFAAEDPLLLNFRRDIEPILAKHCFDCHGNGVDKGGVRLDEFTSAAALRDHQLWSRALRNVRTGLMPPADERPSLEQVSEFTKFIESEWEKADRNVKPDPGRVTVRRVR